MLVRVASIICPILLFPVLISLLQPDQQRVALLILDDAVLVCKICLFPAFLALPEFYFSYVLKAATRTLVPVLDRGKHSVATAALEAVQLFVAKQILAQWAIATEAVSILQDSKRMSGEEEEYLLRMKVGLAMSI